MNWDGRCWSWLGGGTWIVLQYLLVAAQPIAAQVPAPLRQAHAHNDYLHQRPLLDALSHGFNSVEADIYLVDGQLLVAHTAKELEPQRTLRALYLDPLKVLVEQNVGHVHPGKSPRASFGLLIDIKSEAEATYRALHELLKNYESILSTVDKGQTRSGPVAIVISGNRPQELIAAQTKRYCGIDGRIADLDSQKPEHLLPMISDNWTLQFRWRGEGPMPKDELIRLQGIVTRAHEKNRVVRFWATPEKQTVWQALVDADVDLINTDDLPGLEKFLRDQSTKKTKIKKDLQP